MERRTPAPPVRAATATVSPSMVAQGRSNLTEGPEVRARLRILVTEEATPVLYTPSLRGSTEPIIFMLTADRAVRVERADKADTEERAQKVEPVALGQAALVLQELAVRAGQAVAAEKAEQVARVVKGATAVTQRMSS